jgi:hypothetical protein
VPVSGTVVGRLSCIPGLLVLPRHSERGLVYTAEATITDRSGKAIKVASIDCPSELAARVVDTSRAGTIIVEIRCTGDMVTSNRRLSVQLQVSTDEEMETVNVPVLLLRLTEE